ncbi:MAG: hypothetical protein O3B47_04340, partial [bacterium]|nr:hypothetical protein [bacterium]
MLEERSQQDWWKIGLIMSLFLVIIFGYVLSKISGNVLFVKRVGSDLLPYTYIADSILSFIVAMAIAANINRFNVTRLIQIVTLVGIIAYIGLFLLIRQDVFYSYPAYLIFGNVIFEILAAIFMWEVALKLTTPFEAKKNTGYFSLGASLGGIVAGLTSSFLSSYFSTEFLLLPIIGCLGLTLILSIAINVRYNEKLKNTKTDKNKSTIKELGEGFSYFKNNKLSKLVALILVIYGIVGWIIDFEFQKIMGETFTEDKFSQIVGVISIAENLVLLAIFLVLQKWILTRLGIMKALLIAPIFVLVPFSILVILPVYYIVTGLKLIDKATYQSMFSSPIRLIFNAVPNVVRSKVRTLVKSSTNSIGTLIAGIGLILLTRYLSNIWIISIGVGLVIITAIVAYLLKKEYTIQITENLNSQDLDDLHSAIENLAEPAYHRLGVIELMKVLENNNLGAETIRKIVFSLGKIDNVKVIPSLLELFENNDITVKYSVIEAIHGFTDLNKDLEPLPFTRQNILDIYENIFLKEEDPNLKIFILQHLKDFNESEVIMFLKNAMQSKNPSIQGYAIKAMRFFNDRGIIKYVKPFLKNNVKMLKGSAIIALWQFEEMRTKLIQEFVKIISSDETESVLTSLYIISKLHFSWELHYVENKLKDKNKGIRTMAALTLSQLGKTEGIKTITKSLLTLTPYSKIIARNIKELNPRIRGKLFKRIRSMSEK